MVQDAWKNFEVSGKVLDYLAYRHNAGEAAKRGWKESAAFLEEERNGNGRERGSDRDGVKCHADWRV